MDELVNERTASIPGHLANAAQDSPTLHVALSAYRYGRMSWIEAMEAAALELARINKRLLDMNADLLKMKTSTILIERGSLAP